MIEHTTITTVPIQAIAPAIVLVLGHADRLAHARDLASEASALLERARALLQPETEDSVRALGARASTLLARAQRIVEDVASDL